MKGWPIRLSVRYLRRCCTCCGLRAPALSYVSSHGPECVHLIRLHQPDQPREPNLQERIKYYLNPSMSLSSNMLMDIVMFVFLAPMFSIRKRRYIDKIPPTSDETTGIRQLMDRSYGACSTESTADTHPLPFLASRQCALSPLKCPPICRCSKRVSIHSLSPTCPWQVQPHDKSSIRPFKQASSPLRNVGIITFLMISLYLLSTSGGLAPKYRTS